MSGNEVPELVPRLLPRTGVADLRSERPGYIKALLTAGARVDNLGISLLDSQTRFECVNAALARETQTCVAQHVGKSSREIVGDLAAQIEPTYEKVLRTGKPAFAWLGGQVRDAQETGYWFDYCFPVLDKSLRVQQIGLFVVNVTAERTSQEILKALATDSRFLQHQSPALIEWFDGSIRGYYASLHKSLKELACPCSEAARKVDAFRSSMEQLDQDILLMRELMYALIEKLPIPKC